MFNRKKMMTVFLCAIMVFTTCSQVLAVEVKRFQRDIKVATDGKKDVSIDTVIDFTYQEWEKYKDKELQFELFKFSDENELIKTIALDKQRATVVDDVYNVTFKDNLSFTSLDSMQYFVKLFYEGESGKEYIDGFKEWMDLRNEENTIDITIDGQKLKAQDISIFESSLYGDSNYYIDNPYKVELNPNTNYQYTLSLTDSSENVYIVRDTYTTDETGKLVLKKELSKDNFSKININNKKENTAIIVGYLDNRNNYDQMWIKETKNTVFLEKDSEVFKLVAENDIGPVVLDSMFKPSSETTYTVGEGVSSELKIYDRYFDRNNEIENLSKLQQGGTYTFATMFKDDLGNYYDYYDFDDVECYIKKGDEVVYSHDGAYHINGKEVLDTERYIPMYLLEKWYITEEGDYSLKYDIKGTERLSQQINITSRKEMDITISDAQGNLITRDYLTPKEADEGITIKATEHETGTIGAPVEGVVISQRYIGDEFGTTNKEGIVELKHTDRQYYKFEKDGYITKYLFLPVLDEEESIARIKALDKEGNPLTEAKVFLTIEKDGKKRFIQHYISDGNEFAEVIVPANAKITIDFIKRASGNSPGYYILGGFNSGTKKINEIVLDSREPIYGVSKINVGEDIRFINILRNHFSGDLNNDHIYNKFHGSDHFFASNGTYKATVLYDNSGYYDVNELSINGDSKYLTNIDFLNTVKIKPGSGYDIEAIDYFVDANTIMKMWTKNTGDIKLLPGNYKIHMGNMLGDVLYYYAKDINKGELLNTKEYNMETPGKITGLDFIYKNAKGNPVITRNNILVGLKTDNGFNVSAINEVIRDSHGYSENEKEFLTKFKLTDSNGRIMDMTGERKEWIGYPFYVYVHSSGTYTLELTTEINGKTYTLNKTFEAVGIDYSATGTTKPSAPSKPVNDNDDDYIPATKDEPKNEIKEEGKTIKDIVNDTTKTESEKVEAVTKYIDEISKIGKEVKNEKDAEKLINEYSNVLKDTSKLLKNIKDEGEKEKVIEAVNSIVKTTEQALKKVEDGKKSVVLTKNIIKDLGKVLKETQKSNKTEEVKKNLLDLSQIAVEKVGKIKLDNQAIRTEGTSVKAKVSPEAITKQMKETKKAQEELTKELKDTLGEDISNTIKTKITIDVPKVQESTDKFSVELPKEIKESIRENDIDSVKINMDKVAFNIEEDTFAEINNDLTLSSEVVHKIDVNLPATAERIATIPVMEFSAKIGEEKVKQFNKPLEVAFDVSSIDTKKYTSEDLERLTAYKLNESTMKWESVGGIYDPASKTVKILRDNFSKYTVAVANKEYLDVKGNWAEKEINTMLSKGILDDENNFEPNEKVTRQQFVSWISKMFKLKASENVLPFKDIVTTNIYYDEIKAAYENGIIKGKTVDMFEPEECITRQEVATIIVRALELNRKIDKIDMNSINDFTDRQNISKWAEKGIAAMKMTGLIKGYEDGTFRPIENTTKAEAATIIYRIYFGK